MRYITALKVAALALGLGAAITCQAQPGGSYRQTCRDVSVNGSTLRATCQDQGGNWRNTELRDFDRCSGEIQNLNGNLSCSGGNGYGQVEIMATGATATIVTAITTATETEIMIATDITDLQAHIPRPAPTFR